MQHLQPDWNILRSALSIDTWSSKARLAVGTPDVPARSERHLALNVLAPPAATKQESSVICEEKMFQYFEIFAQTHTKKLFQFDVKNDLSASLLSDSLESVCKILHNIKVAKMCSTSP